VWRVIYKELWAQGSDTCGNVVFGRRHSRNCYSRSSELGEQEVPEASQWYKHGAFRVLVNRGQPVCMEEVRFV
jgi:hypothetical protein